MKRSFAGELPKRKRRIQSRLRVRESAPQDKPAFAASGIGFFAVAFGHVAAAISDFW